MREAMKSAPRIDEEMAGRSAEAHGYIVTPVARVRGMVGEQQSDRPEGGGSGRYGWAAIRPVKMTVQDRTGEVREVRLVDAEGQAVKAMAAAGALVAGVALLISILAKLVRQKPVR